MVSRFPATLRRWAVAGLVVVAVASFVALGPRAAIADTPTTALPAAAGAGWLARQLVDGERFEVVFDSTVYWDQGRTIDAILAFAAAGVSGANAQKAIDWLNDPAVLDNYIGDFDDDLGKGFAAGALSKTILAAQVTGKDPTDFAGVDLVSMLLGLQTPAGRFVDSTSYGDFANSFGQSLATIVLHRSGTHDAQATSAAAFLAGIQCDDGGFPLVLGGVTTSPGCDSQVDTTATAVQALLAAGGHGDAVEEGLDFLVSKQDDSGGFSDESDLSQPVNANSTGLAAEALRVGDRDTQADLAVTYLLSLQVGCAGDVANRGAIAYDTDGFDSATAVRATTQAILGLTGKSQADLTLAGSSSDAPTLLCTSPTPASTVSPSATAAPTTTATATDTTTTTDAPTTAVVITTSSPAGTGALPVTGTSLGPILLSGAGLIVVGGVLVLFGRLRRRGTEA